MEEVVSLLEHLETLIYKVLLWILLIPKTIVQIVLHPVFDPEWAHKYVPEELDPQNGKGRFDEYMSPVILLLVVSLLPAVLANFLPAYGLEIVSPAPTVDTQKQSRTLEFDATAKFISSATGGSYEFDWSVQKGQPEKDGYISYSDINPPEQHTTSSGGQSSSIQFIDTHTLKDTFVYNFRDPGKYLVVLSVYKYNSIGSVIEHYTDDTSYVVVPSEFSEDVSVSTYSPTQESQKQSNNEGLSKGAKDASKNLEDFYKQLKSENTYLLALGLLIPPLIFALAIKLFPRGSQQEDQTKSKEDDPASGKKSEISEEFLKTTFYIQCYYFVPINLAFWATYFAIGFLTTDIFGSDIGNLIVPLPLILAAIWFVAVETIAIAKERGISTRKAFWITIACSAIILMGVGILNFRSNPDFQNLGRVWIIRFYLLASFLLLAIWIRKLRSGKQKLTRVQSVAIFGFLLTIFCCLSVVYLAELPGTPGNSAADATQTPTIETQVVTPTSTQVAVATIPPTQAIDLNTPVPVDKRFYTENFSSLDTWTSFLVGGSSNQVRTDNSSGGLTIQLLQQGDTKPWLSLINNVFTYTDVQLQAVMTNNGNNANGVSLICQYSDKGWYEFLVSNSGYYSIVAVDTTTQQAVELATGGSSAIKAGLVQNTYTAICQGNKLTLYINDRPTESITDTKFNFTEGKIGVAVSSPEGLPVDVQINSLQISQPQP